MPEKVLKKLNKYILPQWKVCFFAAIFIGLFAHLYKITNWLPNWDSLVFRYDPQNMIGLGRWFLPVVCAVSSFYDLPFFNGLLAILFHALSAVCICKIFNVQKKTTAFLIGGVIVSFPTVTSVMMYNYVADGYSIAFFLATLAAFFMTKEEPKYYHYIIGAVLLALSTGIYQAYLTVTIMLVLMKLIDTIVFGKAVFRDVFKKALGMLISGGIGMAIYALVLKLTMAIFSVELLDYQGMGDTASLSNLNLAGSLFVIKETFVKCFFDVSGGVNVFVAVNTLVFILTALYYIKSLVKDKGYKNIGRIISAAALAGFSILGAGALAFINADVDYHNLMLMGYSVFYLFFIIIYERGSEKKECHTNFKCWTVLVVALIMIVNQVVISNVSYHKAQMAYEKSYGVLIRIADRIEQTPGAEDCDKILVIGAIENSEMYSVNLTPEITGITDGYIIRADDEVVRQSVLSSALADYCEKDYEFLSGEKKADFTEMDEVKSMGTWPATDCVKVIDDTLIIKMGEEGES